MPRANQAQILLHPFDVGVRRLQGLFNAHQSAGRVLKLLGKVKQELAVFWRVQVLARVDDNTDQRVS